MLPVKLLRVNVAVTPSSMSNAAPPSDATLPWNTVSSQVRMAPDATSMAAPCSAWLPRKRQASMSRRTAPSAYMAPPLLPLLP